MGTHSYRGIIIGCKPAKWLSLIYYLSCCLQVICSPLSLTNSDYGKQHPPSLSIPLATHFTRQRIRDLLAKTGTAPAVTRSRGAHLPAAAGPPRPLPVQKHPAGRLLPSLGDKQTEASLGRLDDPAATVVLPESATPRPSVESNLQVRELPAGIFRQLNGPERNKRFN
ncbi:hypothetical protein LZ31DRAFT_596395 [Colletotrichum somersetense]|nr:hypothetical protein LZ31DRAFT_596395 [Colletotrichum somersetense]